MSAVEVLRKARALIERGWCQGHGAEDSSGKATYSLDPAATCFCPMGAVARVTGGYVIDTLAYKQLVAAIGGGELSCWNDRKERTQTEVLAAFDRAIALAESARVETWGNCNPARRRRKAKTMDTRFLDFADETEPAALSPWVVVDGGKQHAARVEEYQLASRDRLPNWWIASVYGLILWTLVLVVWTALMVVIGTVLLPAR